MTKITIVSGFLGAGKTTFIKKLIQEVFCGESIVLIENEYGEIGVDGSFLKDAGIEITEMNSGCICCTLVGDFTASLCQVLEKFKPDRILIEPSGVGKLSDIVAAVEAVKKTQDICITEKIVVADGKKAVMYLKNFGEFYKDQVLNASTIVMSRTQLMEEDKLHAAEVALRAVNASAPMITTDWSLLDAEAIRRALEKSEPDSFMEDACEHHHGHHHHEHKHDECCCGHDHHHEPHHHEHEHDECCCGHDHHHEHHHHEHEHGECCCGHDHHHDHHHADEVFISWGRETSRKYTADEIGDILEGLSGGAASGTILRAKGIVALTDGSWLQFDLVPGEYETRSGSPDYTGRLCVIGTELTDDSLEKLFLLKA